MEEDKGNAVTTGFKGFDKDLKCRGFQYEIGKTFEQEQDPEICKHGFHFCEHPLNCFYYYAPGQSRYCAVSTDCVSPQTHGDTKRDTKRVTKCISIGAEISIAGLVKAAVEYTWERATVEGGAHATGTHGAASATGEYSVALAAGLESKAKGALGCAICCVERDEDNRRIIAIKAAIVDGDTIKADIWYSLQSGEFVESD